MRATIHNGRTGADGKAYSSKHNDRNFNTTKETAEHIDAERTKDNISFSYAHNEHPEWTFDRAEKEFYDRRFGEHLKQQNDRYVKSGHAERVKTMDEYRHAKQSCPEETLYYLGSKDDHADVETLKKIINKQLRWEMETFPQVMVLDIALHMDEATPHYHKRQVWVSKDKDGNEVVSQNKALEDMGIRKPDPSKETSRWNNAKMTYTKMCRDHLLELCKEYGLEIETEPKEKSRSGLSQLEYKAQQAQERAENALRRVSELEADKSTLEAENARLTAQIDAQNNDIGKNSDLIVKQNADISDLESSLTADMDKKKDLQESVDRLKREKHILTTTEVKEIETKTSLTGKYTKVLTEDFKGLLNTASMVTAQQKDYNKRLDQLAKDRQAAEAEKQAMLTQARQDASDILQKAKEERDRKDKELQKKWNFMVENREEYKRYEEELPSLRKERQWYADIEKQLEADTTKTFFMELTDNGELYKHLQDGTLLALTDDGIRRIPAFQGGLSEIEKAYNTTHLGIMAEEPYKDMPLHVIAEVTEKLYANNIPLSKDARIELQKATTLQRTAKQIDRDDIIR